MQQIEGTRVLYDSGIYFFPAYEGELTEEELILIEQDRRELRKRIDEAKRKFWEVGASGKSRVSSY